MYKALVKDRVKAVGGLWVSGRQLFVKKVMVVLGWVEVGVCAQHIRYLYDLFSAIFSALNNLLFVKSSTSSTALTKETINLNKLLFLIGVYV